MNEPATLTSWFYLPATVVGTLIAPRLGVIADKINPYITITITSIIGGIVTWIIVFLTTNIWIFSILLIIDNTIMLFLSRISEKHRGKIFGLITTFDSLGYIIGPIVGGFAYDINYTIPFIISILVEWALIPFFVLGIWILNPQIVETLEEKISQ